MTLHRSYLFVPGDNTRALGKAASLAADALIIDLEDAVAPENKDQARGQAVAFVDFPPRIVRC